MRTLAVVCVSVSALLTAQAPTAPVVNPRGVVNAFTQQPAPSPVAPGGIIWINGINLGPAAGWSAEPGVPLPTTALDPPIEVRIGQRAIPLYSMTPSRIVAQVPVDTPQGVTQIVVRRGEQQSQPARFTVTPPNPAIDTALGGFGPAGTVSANTLTLRVAGLGPTNPETAAPRAAIRANVGGMPGPVITQISSQTPGEFEVAIELPPTAQDGDVVNLYAANNAGNRVTLKSVNGPKVDFLRLPADTNNMRAITVSDLRPGYLVLSGARAEDGCYPSILVDFDAKKADTLPGCHIAAAAQVQTPFAASNDGNAIASLLGPADGEAATGISSQVTLLVPSTEPRNIELPGKATTLGAGAGGNFNAILPGTPIRVALIDPETGEVTEATPGGGVVIGGGGGGGAVNINGLLIDLETTSRTSSPRQPPWARTSRPSSESTPSKPQPKPNSVSSTGRAKPSSP
jgi:uncharacterized protein (TIGR03437 family)